MGVAEAALQLQGLHLHTRGTGASESGRGQELGNQLRVALPEQRIQAKAWPGHPVDRGEPAKDGGEPGGAFTHLHGALGPSHNCTLPNCTAAPSHLCKVGGPSHNRTHLFLEGLNVKGGGERVLHLTAGIGDDVDREDNLQGRSGSGEGTETV